MKILSLLTLLTAASAGGAADPYPANNSQYFVDGSLNPAYAQKWVAVEGAIMEIRSAHRGKPLLRIRLPHPVNKDIWVGSLVANDHALLQEGHIVRTLGYLLKTDQGDPYLARTGAKYVILGACVLDITEKKALFLPDAIVNCTSWQNGTKPEGL